MTDAPISRDSADWPRLKRWLLVRTTKLQRQLEDVNAGIPEASHNVTRGKIAAYRDLLAEVEPARLLEASDVEDQALDSSVDY